MSEPKCPKCGGSYLLIERRPDGEAGCLDCDWRGKYAECFKLDPITQPLASMQQRIAELENERKVQDVRIQSCEQIMSDLERRFDRERGRRIEAEKALEWYADENGGPYAPGDHHSADGGKRAREYFKKWNNKRTSAESEK
jgi:hypothetical protein